MRITGCRLGAYGQFQDVAVSGIDHPIVVLFGPNEAGKSTFFHFLEAMLYGIYPVSIENHPYAPRDGRFLEGELSLRTANGVSARVIRKLMSTPTGRLFHMSREMDLRNKELPFVQHIPQGVFESVFTLTLRDMAAIEPKAWTEIESRLLGNLNVESIRPARVVASELEEAANQLWRSDRKGKPEARQLEIKVRELGSELKLARQQDEALRRLRDQIARDETCLISLREEKSDLLLAQRRMRHIIPVHRLITKIKALEAEAGDQNDLRDLPADPSETLKGYIERIKEIEVKRREVMEILQQQREIIASFTEAEAGILEQATLIRTWVRKVEAHESKVARLEQVRQDMMVSRARLEHHADRALSISWDERLIPTFRDLSEAELRHRVKTYQVAAGRLQKAEEESRLLTLSSGERQTLMPGILMLCTGLIVGVVGFLTGIPWIRWMGLLILSMGFVYVMMAHHQNRRVKEKPRRVDVETPRREVTAAADAAATFLSPLPLPDGKKRCPDQELLDDIRAIRADVHEFLGLQRHVQTLAQEVQLNAKAVQDLTQATGRCWAGTLSETIAQLEEALGAAQEIDRQRRTAESKVLELNARDEQLREEQDRYETWKTSLENHLARLGQGDLGKGSESYLLRRQAAEEAAVHRKTLDRDFPDWKSILAEIEQLGPVTSNWNVNDAEDIRLTQQLEQVQNEIEELQKKITRAQIEAGRLEEKRSPNTVESEKEYVEAELESVCRRRDRLMLLARIIRRADHEFRLKHQPDVIKRASAYLKQITEGRYERLILEEGTNRLLTYTRNGSLPLPVSEPLSRGTLDQIYLSIRLAIIDHLDEGQERLPLFLDEVFVNWDAGRRRVGLEILDKVSQDRQVFTFTCHSWFAEELEQHARAHVIKLDPTVFACASTTVSLLNG